MAGRVFPCELGFKSHVSGLTTEPTTKDIGTYINATMVTDNESAAKSAVTYKLRTELSMISMSCILTDRVTD